MNVLYLCPDLGVPVLGHKGASIHVRQLVTALRRGGHRVVVAAACLTKSPWEEPVALGGPLVHLPPRRETLDAVAGLKAWRDGLGARSALPAELRRIMYDADLGEALRERFAHHRPDVVYERASLYGTAGGDFARAIGVPHIVELNAPLALEHSTYRAAGVDDLPAAAERRLLTQADAVVVVSGALREHAIAVGADPARVTVRPNGVDALRFRPAERDPAVRERLGLDGGVTIGFVGGLRPWHGVDVLPELLGRLAAAHPDVRLVIAGDGPMAPVLRADLAARGLSDRAVLAGAIPHDQMPDVIRQLDVALAPYPAVDHPFYFSPLKIYEYMACGVPVVASAVGAVPDLVRDGETGLLYRAGDVDGLARACERLLGDRALAARVGAAACEQVRDHHTWDRIAAETAEQAGELVAARRAGR